MKILVTGGCGFLGSNLARETLLRGHTLGVLDNLCRPGSERNLEWLKTLGKFEFYAQDVRDPAAVDRIFESFRPEGVFHLAGQVAMTTSIADPRRDFETNALGTLNVLEALRKNTPQTWIMYSSTNKVYGELEGVPLVEQSSRYTAPSHPYGIDEGAALDFRSPYGVSKGSADQMMLDYARIFGTRATVFRHSSIFGERQFSSFDQGWIGWFVQQAIETRKNSMHEFTVSGDGKQVRDVLFSSDIVSCYFDALAHSEQVRGEVFNIGGGVKNSLSLLELFDFLEQKLSVKLRFQRLPWRQSDQRYFVADIRKAQRVFGWEPRMDWQSGVSRMVDWCLTHD